ncbi:hypothetical protein BAUCODRAFT_80140 [Baudoinia panamericana UAMH 10762]|uniref:histidine kinase n=1 Tax=Baudoinia panamericana (strain UAMH 10762) TaxID=717646 RepID=M2MYH3_BAUPA|nr:uncharacterized protein BAUCODRAFT_80140 [Baudoinia panamericana UAMH 10762]EMC91350.1 hypothetical protein BAUCODRAFT_80140 [Baudoinia panamericana UAMH 10762]
MHRRSICFPRPGTQTVIQDGDSDFAPELDRLYAKSENDALEALVALKARVRDLPTDDFWSAVTEGMSAITGAEMAFIMKRVLVDEQEAAVEMPPLGAQGSCMMAAAFHYCTHDGKKNTVKHSKFQAWGCPCAYMRHDKVFLIPENLNNFITNNPNQLPMPAEAYMAVPLFAEGRCFAHFGVMWSNESAAQRAMSWAFIEMLLHSLEDIILQRFLEGSNFVRPAAVPQDKARVIPHEAVSMAQSLRPYAPSLSHELRTPMQGVVGMLDVMYATVQEAVETQKDPLLRKIFQILKENIEVVQDSSRRAVEAADNFVHAADMDLTLPEPAPLLAHDESIDSASPWSATAHDRRPEILVAGSNLPLSRPNKRRREEANSRTGSNASSAKIPRYDGASSVWSKGPEPSQGVVEGLHEAEQLQAQATQGATAMVNAPTVEDVEFATNAMQQGSRIIAPGLRHTNMREIFQYVISEGLKMGGRPDSATTQETDVGELIEVRSRGSDGTVSNKTIEWSVDPSVPHTMFVDEKDLTKLISCVFLNAVKFTDGLHGRVRCSARMSQRGRYISIRINDNGPGIPAAFLPKLFKPFSQENGSITRPSEGLGLGLMVAKGIARKLGGDLMCTRAETAGPNHGSEFEIKIPVTAGETISRPSSPFHSPMPRKAQMAQAEHQYIPPLPPFPASPRRLSQALDNIITQPPLQSGSVAESYPSTPPSPRSVANLAAPPGREHTATPPSPSEQPHVPKPPRVRKSAANAEIDRELANKYPLTFLVAEDNKINRKLLVNMLSKLGYKHIIEAHDGAEAVRQMMLNRTQRTKNGSEKPLVPPIDVVLMDLWMPLMDGYEATEKILSMDVERPTVLAVTADVTDGALERAAQVGMTGFMTKPYKMMDLQRLITEYCARSQVEQEIPRGMPEGLAVS